MKKISLLLLIVIMTAAFAMLANGETITLPESLTRIEDEAFAGLQADFVVFPDHLEYIAEDAFDGASFVGTGIPESYAQEWCEAHGFEFKPFETPVEDFEWETINGLEARIKKYNGQSNRVYIPLEIEDYTITELASNCFATKTTLEYVYIPGNVKTIGNYAFSRCESLVDVVFCNGIKSIGKGAFEGCIRLKAIQLPDSVNEILSFAFNGCTSLSEFLYPQSLSNAWTNDYDSYLGFIFKDCSMLASIEIPEGIESVPSYLFKGSNCLKYVSLPSTLKSIEESCFADCTSITSIIYPDGLELIGNNAFKGCTNLKNVNLPSSVKKIGNGAFANCISFTDIEFQEGLESIGKSAFEGCINLESVKLPDSVNEILSYAFNGCINISEFIYPLGLNNVWTNDYDSQLGYIFKDCKKLRSIDIPEGIISIPSYMFRGSNYLRSVNLPLTLKNIGDSAFADCVAMPSIQFNEGIEIIGNSAFRGCTNLGNINIPSSVKKIGDSAFANCITFTSVGFQEGLESIGKSAFEGCVNLSAAILPNSVNEILSYAFNGCINLAEFTYPLNLNNVWTNDYGRYLGFIFKDCKKLKTIIVPENVQTIPSYVFRGSNYLQNIILPTSIEVIGDSAFADCEILEKIYLGYNISSIGNDAFNNCTILTIWTEYNAFALQYAKENEISYYYLTPDGINSPNGTLYRGDSYGLRGYAHSSIEMTELTATIWDSDKESIVQQITVIPDDLDYTLSGKINSNLRFEQLPLGTYHYTLIAKTELSEEQWADTTFTIAPPPLRISLRNPSLPSGLFRAGEASNIAGMIISNYSITKVTVKIIDNADGSTARTFNATPNQLQYDLSAANSSLNLGSLPYSNYSIQIIAISNGETRTLLTSDFDPVNYEGSIEDETITKLIFYAADEAHRDVFTQSYAKQVVDEMTWIEYGIVIVDNVANVNIFKEAIKKAAGGSIDQSNKLVDLYKQEIYNLLDDGAYDGITVAEDLKSDVNGILTNLKDGTKIGKEVIKNEKLKSYIEICNAIVKGLKKGASYGADIEEGLNNIGICLTNVDDKLAVLESMKRSSEFGGASEFTVAVDLVADEYMCWVNASLQEVSNIFIDVISDYSSEIYQEAIKKLEEYVYGQGNSRLSRFGFAQLGLKIGLKATGLDDTAENYKTFFIQYNILNNGINEYKAAFDIVHNGDTSTNAINRFYIAGNTVKAEWIRLHDTITKLPAYSYTIGNQALDYWDANLRNTMPFTCNVSF